MVVEGGHSKKIQSLEPTVLSAEPKCMKLNNRACGSLISEASIRILFSAALVETRQGMGIVSSNHFLYIGLMIRS